MPQIRSLAVEPQSVETPTWRSTRYKHWIEGFIVDGDYFLVKVNKRTFMRYTEYVWNELIPPFPVPAGEGIPTLINPDDPFYIWDEKPEKWHPCWLRGRGTELTIVDMVTNKVIGHGTPVRTGAVVLSCDCEGFDPWAEERCMATDLFRDLSLDVTELILPTKAEVMAELSRCYYWHALAHGTQRVFMLVPEGEVTSSEVEGVLADRDPYIYAFADHCSAMEDTGPGTWARVFTKNMRGHIVLGLKYVNENPDAWPYIIDWKVRFYDYIRQGLSICDAFENSVVDIPQITPIVDIYEGTEAPVVTYTLTLAVSPSGGGYTSPAVGSHKYDKGASVTIEAYPYKGYEFDHWYVVFIQSGVTVLGYSWWDLLPMTEDIQAIAYFREIGVVTYTLSTSVTPSGSGTVSPSSGTYNEGSIVTLTATPHSGYEFSHWSGNASGTSRTVNVVMNMDRHVVANFIREEAPPPDWTSMLAPVMLIGLMGMVAATMAKALR